MAEYGTKTFKQSHNFKKSVSTIGDTADFGTELDSKVEEWLKGESAEKAVLGVQDTLLTVPIEDGITVHMYRCVFWRS